MTTAGSIFTSRLNFHIPDIKKGDTFSVWLFGKKDSLSLLCDPSSLVIISDIYIGNVSLFTKGGQYIIIFNQHNYVHYNYRKHYSKCNSIKLYNIIHSNNPLRKRKCKAFLKVLFYCWKFQILYWNKTIYWLRLNWSAFTNP